MRKTDALIIMDGFGLGPPKDNAIAFQGTPNLKQLRDHYPHTQIQASGRSVGLPAGQMGNSEVGHLNLGAGRVVYQDITRIDKAIEDGIFFENKAFLDAVQHCKQHNSALHLVGLLSDGGVHSSINHLYALIELAKREGLTAVYIHCILDGRDTSPTSGTGFLRDLTGVLTRQGVGKIATIVGRYYYMDRDNRWERVQKGYNCVFAGEGTRAVCGYEAVTDSYNKGITDEFMEPIIIEDYAGVATGDSMIFYNFRSDRAREISRAVIFEDFDAFERKGGYKDIYYVGMTQYDATFPKIHVAFDKVEIKCTLGEYLARSGKTQVRIAETEKYAHVTFFFNGGVEVPNPSEQRILVPSPKVPTYDIQPEMSAFEVTEKALEAIEAGVDVMILNFANCDMVGHTGVFEAAVKAVETVDICVKRVVDKILESGGSAIVTADHGNAEFMKYEDGSLMTAHTTNPVPLILVSRQFAGKKLKAGGALCDVAPTLLELIGLPKPEEMEGHSLIEP